MAAISIPVPLLKALTAQVKYVTATAKTHITPVGRITLTTGIKAPEQWDDSPSDPAFIYAYPKNFPTSSIRFYRFAYEGIRESARLNLLLHSVVGDLRTIHTALEDTESAIGNVGIYDYHNHPVELDGPGEYNANKSVHMAPISLTAGIKESTVRYNISSAVAKMAAAYSFRTGYPQIGISVPTKALTTGVNHPTISAATVLTQAPGMEPTITFNRPTVTTT